MRAGDTGEIEMSRPLEPLAMLWIINYFKTNTGNHAFRLDKEMILAMTEFSRI